MSQNAKRRTAGAGNVRKRGGSVIVNGVPHRTYTYQFSVRDPETGRRRLVSGSRDSVGQPLLTVAAANEAMAAHRQKVLEGAVPVRRASGSVDAYLTGWLEQLAAAVASGKRRPTTEAHHRTTVNNYLIPTLGRVPLAKLGPNDIAAALVKLRTSGGKDGRALSAATVHHAFVTLSKALNAAVTAGVIAKSPIAKMTEDQKPERPSAKSRTRAIAAWSGSDAQKFAEAALRDDDPAALALIFAMRTGLRRGELVALRWEDITEETREDGRRAGRVTVKRSTVMLGGQRHESLPKTDAGHRSIPVGTEVMGVLSSARAAQSKQRLAAGQGWTGPPPGSPDAPVFRQADGAPLHPQQLRHPLVRIARAAGLPALSVHGLRHTFATIALVEQRIPIPVLSKWLGHASASTTLDVYAHVLQEADQHYADSLDASYRTGS